MEEVFIKKEKNKLIIAIVICLVVIVSVIGYTYSFFAVNTSNNSVITGTAASLSLTVTVTKESPSITGGLIPQLDAYITSAVTGRNGSCIDDNNNPVCQVYKIHVKNNSGVTINVDGTVELDAKNNPNLKWAIISGLTTPTVSGNIKTYNETTLTSNETYTGLQEKDYYIVTWISETGLRQTDTGVFSGVVTFGDAKKAMVTLNNLNLTNSIKKGTPNFDRISPSFVLDGTGSNTISAVDNQSIYVGDSYLYSSNNGFYMQNLRSTYLLDNSVEGYICPDFHRENTCLTNEILKITNISFSEPSYWASAGQYQGKKYFSSSYHIEGDEFVLNGAGSGWIGEVVDTYTCLGGTSCTTLYRVVSSNYIPPSYDDEGNQIESESWIGYLESIDISDIYIRFNFNRYIMTTESGVGIFESEDDLGTSYYFRGNIENNYVKFGKNSSGTDMYWRIVRINGDGSIRLIYDGTSAHANGVSSPDRRVSGSEFNPSYNDNTYVGYMYGTAGASTYEETHANTNNSTIKTYLDDWYKTNIVDTGYSSYVTDAIYCNDRSLDTSNASYTGIGTTTTYYAGNQRIITNKAPILTCPQDNDKFTVSSELGNGKLTYPVGLITIDELALAGGTYNTINNLYYLYTGFDFWTMTPRYFSGSVVREFVDSPNGFTDDTVSDPSSVRPVISIRQSAITGGTGTSTDPFTVS